jgi:hypothetical protein
MKVLFGVCATLTLAVMAAPQHAQAQPVFANRCATDSLDPVGAEARLNWARRCALLLHVGSPSYWFDTFAPASNGGTLKDYAEDDVYYNPLGQNRYIGQLHYYEANAATVFSLYTPGATAQGADPYGYYRWDRTIDRKKPRPLYPTFGTLADIYSPSNVQLFPNPYNPNDCGLYTAYQLGLLGGAGGAIAQRLPIDEHPCIADEGTSCYEPPPPPPPTPASYFFINAYCESSCYAPNQRVLFPDGPAAIADAHAAAKPEVMTVAPGSLLHEVSLQAQPTYSYTAELRDSTHPMVQLVMASGGKLLVTTDHPMVNGEGRLVEAQALKVGDELIRKDGTFDPIAKVSRTTHFGKVYNLRPESNDRVANILVAEDYLVGSSLFQNDEVGYMNRILLHKSIPVELIP